MGNLNSRLDSTAQIKSLTLVLLHVLKLNMIANVFTRVHKRKYAHKKENERERDRSQTI